MLHPLAAILTLSLAAATISIAEAASDGSASAPEYASRVPLAACAVVDGPCRWGHTYGGAGEDRAYGLAPLADGGWILAGNTRRSPGNDIDAWVIRLDQDGRPIWERTFGGRQADQVFTVAPTLDGGAVLAGHTRSTGQGESDLWLFRLDGDGELVWQRVLGGVGNDRIRSVIATADGGFLAGGFTASRGAGDRDAWVLRLDGGGDVLWERVFGGPGDDGAFHATVLPRGGFAVVGYRTASAGYDLWVLNLSDGGEAVWTRTLDRSEFDAGTGIIPTPDGGVILAGMTAIPGTLRDNVWLVRLDDSGDVVWERVLGGQARDNAWAIAPLDNGGAVIAAATSSRGAGSADAWVLAITDTGEVAWERIIGGEKWDRPTAVSIGEDGNVVVAGYTTTIGAGFEDYWIFKLAPAD